MVGIGLLNESEFEADACVWPGEEGELVTPDTRHGLSSFGRRLVEPTFDTTYINDNSSV